VRWSGVCTLRSLTSLLNVFRLVLCDRSRPICTLLRIALQPQHNIFASIHLSSLAREVHTPRFSHPAAVMLLSRSLPRQMLSSRSLVITTASRHFTTSSPMASSTTNNQFSISANSDEGKVIAQAQSLIDSHKWTLCNDGKGLERAFKFKTFNATWVCTSSHLVSALHLADSGAKGFHDSRRHPVQTDTASPGVVERVQSCQHPLDDALT